VDEVLLVIGHAVESFPFVRYAHCFVRREFNEVDLDVLVILPGLLVQLLLLEPLELVRIR